VTTIAGASAGCWSAMAWPLDAEATDPLAAESLALATGTTFHYVTGWIRSAGRPSRCATLAG
jgi:hypothetical protein